MEDDGFTPLWQFPPGTRLLTKLEVHAQHAPKEKERNAPGPKPNRRGARSPRETNDRHERWCKEWASDWAMFKADQLTKGWRVDDQGSWHELNPKPVRA